jgi:hypothetical protein
MNAITFRKWLTPAILFMLILGAQRSWAVQAVTNGKTLSTNLTLVNLAPGANSGVVRYLRDDGTEWRDPEPFSFASQGDQLIWRQYDSGSGLDTGRGSIVVSSSEPLGSVVQILARRQTASSGAYAGIPTSATSIYIPLLVRKVASASGVANSQIAINNAGASTTDVEIKFYDETGALTFTKTGISLVAGASLLYDLASEASSSLPDGWRGSGEVHVLTASGRIIAMANLFSGPHAVQSFGGFSEAGQEWLAPLFASRLPNTLSTPVTVQNLSGRTIPVGGIKARCVADAASSSPNFNLSNSREVPHLAAYSFNPVTDLAIPTGWFGGCRIETTGHQTIAFVQMRLVGGDQAAAYEALRVEDVSTQLLIPLYAKRLTNGFATSVVIQNLNNDADAHIDLRYKGALGTPAGCTITLENVLIPAGGSLIQNHRLDQTGPGAVPALGNNCFGTLTVTSRDQNIGAMVQLTDISGAAGDTWMAHNAFNITANDVHAQMQAGRELRMPLIGNDLPTP